VKTAFDNDRYLAEQTASIQERMARFSGRLYLEFGGKLLNDFHASRVLPGYDPNVKVRLLQRLGSDAEIVLCIHAGAIEQRKIRADFGITYDADALKLIDDLGEWGLPVAAVVITRWEDQPQARAFRTKLEHRGVRVYAHAPIKGYPQDPDLVVSEAGYGANPRIEVSRPLVVVTGPGPGSGKMATCLSQVYHDHRLGIHSMYAKFETFPIWNLPLDHPVNVAYEAATLDLKDFNVVDPYHKAATGEVAVNYNRDVESFLILEAILDRITGGAGVYRSPTEMGVNRAGFAILDDGVAREAARQEIIRRYLRCTCEYTMGALGRSALDKVEALMKAQGIGPEYRPVVPAARQAAIDARLDSLSRPDAPGVKGVDSIWCGAALELPDGRLVAGKNSRLLHAATAAILNATKVLAGVPDSIHLLSPIVMESIARFKGDVLRRRNASLDVDEALIALSISTALNPMVQACVDCLPVLRGCQMHLTHLPSPGDEAGLRKLGVNLTSDPIYASRRLFLE